MFRSWHCLHYCHPPIGKIIACNILLLLTDPKWTIYNFSLSQIRVHQNTYISITTPTYNAKKKPKTPQPVDITVLEKILKSLIIGGLGHRLRTQVAYRLDACL